jgi:HSP20 family molecular chaperone IbpA
VQVQARKDERELVISGERPAPEQSEEEKGFRRRVERRFGKFSRTFSVRRPGVRPSH